MLNHAFMQEVGYFQWTFRTAVRQLYMRVLKRNHAMRLPTGEWMSLPFSSRFASEAFVSGGDVDWGSEKLLSLLMDGHGDFLDVGANIGYYSLYMAPVVSEVYSFEPDPRTRQELERNVGSHSKIHVVPSAVGSEQRVALFTLEQSAEVSHLSSNSECADNQIQVYVDTVDNFVTARSLQVGAIKIDAEGHDTEVIAGALEVLAAQTPVVLTESEPNAALFQLTDQVGYRVFAYVRHSKTRRRSFSELISGTPVAGDCKMIFLVPPRLSDKIKQFAETC